MLKRVCSLTMALLLVLSLLPMGALAASGAEGVLKPIVHINPEYQDSQLEAELRLDGTPRAAGSEPSIYHTSMADAAAEMRQNMKAREDVITIGILVSSDVTQELFETVSHGISDMALEHTGVPDEGDYIHKQYGGWNCSGSYTGRKLAVTYTMRYYTTAAQEKEMDAAVDRVLSSLNVWNGSNYDKIKAVYDFICDNVSYDYENLNDSSYKLKHTAYAALINRTSVCQGFAVLFYRLALELGVDARYISGYGNGGAHGWNIAKICDRYYNLDATWDENRSGYDYFLKGDSFFQDHERGSAYTTAAFLAEYPLSAADYEDHEHSYVVTVVDPTCTAQGYTLHSCSFGHAYKDQYINALGHIYQLTGYSAPDCTSNGYTGDNICTRCGDTVYGAVIPVTGHNYTETITAPTCTEQGYTTHTCQCGDCYRDRYTDALGHTFQVCAGKNPSCTETGFEKYACIVCWDPAAACQVIVPALGHCWDEGEITAQPTEDSEGIKTFTCMTCGEKREQAIPQLDHVHIYTETITAPTCTEQGYTTHTCQCGDSYRDSYTDPHGHTFEACAGNYPSCTETGFEEYACIVCWDPTATYQVIVPALGHNWNEGIITVQPTENKEGVKTFTCTVCGDIREEAVPTIAPSIPSFADVEPGAFYTDAINWAVAKKITSGTSATTFSPMKNCTRADVVTFLWRANGSPAPKSANNPFTDVENGQYYTDAVLWAVEQGITKGIDVDKFGTLDSVTRGQFVTFLWRAKGCPEGFGNNPFVDVDNGQFYTQAILWAYGNGITDGVTATTFEPERPCTRGQVVTFLYRAYA